MGDIKTRAARQIVCLSFIQANEEFFSDGYNVEWNGISSYFYNSFVGDIEQNDAKQKLIACMNLIRKEWPGCTVTKEYAGQYFTCTIRSPVHNVIFKLMAARKNVCTMIETGETEMVEEIDYSEAPRKMVEKPVVRWECDPLLTD